MRPVSGYRSPTLVQRLELWGQTPGDPHASMDGSDRCSSQYTDVDTPPSIAYTIFPSSDQQRPPVPHFDPKRLSTMYGGGGGGPETMLSRSFESELTLDCGLFPVPPIRPSLDVEMAREMATTATSSAARVTKAGFEPSPSYCGPSGRPTLEDLVEDSEENAPWLAYMTGELAPPTGSNESTSSPQRKIRDSPLRAVPRRRPHTSDAMFRSGSTGSDLSASSLSSPPHRQRLLSHGGITTTSDETETSLSKKLSSGFPPKSAPSARLGMSSIGFGAYSVRGSLALYDDNAAIASRSKLSETQALRLSTKPRAMPPPHLPLPDPYAQTNAVHVDVMTTAKLVSIRPRTASLSSRSSRLLLDGLALSDRSPRDHMGLPSPATPLTPMPRTPGSATPLGRVPFPGEAGEADHYLRLRPSRESVSSRLDDGADTMTRLRSKSAAGPSSASAARPRTAPGPAPSPWRLQPMASSSHLAAPTRTATKTTTTQRHEIRRSRSSTLRTVSQMFGGKLKTLGRTIVGSDSKEASSSSSGSGDEDTSDVWGTQYRDPTLDLEEWWMDTLNRYHLSTSPSITSVSAEQRAVGRADGLDDDVRGLTVWADRALEEQAFPPTRIAHPYQYDGFTPSGRRSEAASLRSSSNRSPGHGVVDDGPELVCDPTLEGHQGDVSLDYASIALGITETEYVEEAEQYQQQTFQNYQSYYDDDDEIDNNNNSSNTLLHQHRSSILPAAYAKPLPRQVTHNPSACT